jgi:hypothetical protein
MIQAGEEELFDFGVAIRFRRGVESVRAIGAQRI